MDFSSFQFLRLSGESVIPEFDCDDTDLNEFLFEDSKDYSDRLIATTYLLVDSENDKTVAFFSVLNDKISVTDIESGRQWKKRIQSVLPTGKKFKSYPAVKLGRLGVHNDYKGQGIGRSIMDFLKMWFIKRNKTGCKYMTVDAYNASLEFYEKNGFDYLTKKDEDSHTRLMYFDLYTIK